MKGYAHDLKDWFSFLTDRAIDWREVRLEDFGGFIGWLRLPPAARGGEVPVLPSVPAHCSASSVNRKLSALSSAVVTSNQPDPSHPLTSAAHPTERSSGRLISDGLRRPHLDGLRWPHHG